MNNQLEVHDCRTMTHPSCAKDELSIAKLDGTNIDETTDVLDMIPIPSPAFYNKNMQI